MEGLYMVTKTDRSLSSGLDFELYCHTFEPGRGGVTLACGRGVGKSQFRRLEKKFSTQPTLCLPGRRSHFRFGPRTESFSGHKIFPAKPPRIC
jgi:hypothetical protein